MVLPVGCWPFVTSAVCPLTSGILTMARSAIWSRRCSRPSSVRRVGRSTPTNSRANMRKGREAPARRDAFSAP